MKDQLLSDSRRLLSSLSTQIWFNWCFIPHSKTIVLKGIGSHPSLDVTEVTWILKYPVKRNKSTRSNLDIIHTPMVSSTENTTIVRILSFYLTNFVTSYAVVMTPANIPMMVYIVSTIYQVIVCSTKYRTHFYSYKSYMLICVLCVSKHLKWAHLPSCIPQNV